MPTEKVVDKIISNYPKMTKSQKIIANYVEENYNKIPSMSVKDLSDAINMSYATIVRFSQMLGYDGYLEMRASIKKENSDYYSAHSRFDRLSEGNSKQGNLSIAKKIIQNDLDNLNDTIKNFDDETFANVVSEINMADRIHLVGFGTDATIVTFLDWYMDYMGFNTVVHTDAGFRSSVKISGMKHGDLVIMFATPRYLKMEMDILLLARDVGVKSVCISPGNAFEFLSTCDYPITVTDKASSLINSYVCYMAVANALILSIYDSNKDVIDKHIKETEKNEKYFDILL